MRGQIGEQTAGKTLPFCKGCKFADRKQLEATGEGFCSNEWTCDPSNYWAEFRPRKEVA